MNRWIIILWLAFGTVAQAARPNILLIIADDYGADGSSLFNSTNGGAILPPTPNIASLVTNGVVFRSAYANPLCSPTRACLLTGRHGFRPAVGRVEQRAAIRAVVIGDDQQNVRPGRMGDSPKRQPE